MARFLDFWNVRGSWAELGADRQRALAETSAQVGRDFEAIFGERIHLSVFRKLVTPTLIVTGTTSPAGSRLVAEGLARAAARASTISIPGAGHMLPMTHGPELTRILRARWDVETQLNLRAA
jgi:pimeloyl-ACP methyl ester carboxylesterase